MANHHIDIQRACSGIEQPDDNHLQFWVDSVLQNEPEIQTLQQELCLRIVDEAEIVALNQQYRHRTGSTNVLSFPAENIPEIPENRLGDIVICAQVVNQEACQQNKTPDSHWAHMVVHGVLHLCGYDHLQEQDARLMEDREVLILKKLGFSNPYEVK